MGRLAWAFLVALGVGLVACGQEDDAAGDAAAATSGGGGAAGGAGACGPGFTLGADGVCKTPGVPPDGCAPGFEHDDAGGCVAVLPQTACPKGSMALPGETTCRPVAPCGPAPWGDVATDAMTQFVDAAYAGGGSDGSAEKPWITIQDGVDAAADGATVVVAAGSYAETIMIGAPVNVVGRCPDLVEVVSASQEPGIVFVPGASGSSIRALSFTGYIGVAATSMEELTLESLWFHDLDAPAVYLADDLGPVRATVHGCLAEDAAGAAINGSGDVSLRLEASVVRDARPGLDAPGAGVFVAPRPPGPSGKLEVAGSIIERCGGQGVYTSVPATIDATLVRDIELSAQGFGRGIEGYADAGADVTVTITRSVIERADEVGVGMLGVHATLENVVVRDTNPRAVPVYLAGVGFAVATETGGPRGSAHITTSFFDNNRFAGLAVVAADGGIDCVWVRNTAADVTTGLGGRGISLGYDTKSGEGARATVVRSLVEQSFEVGVVALGSDSTLDGTLVRDTQARADGLFGDGVVALVGLAYSGGPVQASARLVGSAVVSSARAGLAVFGATADMSGSRLECNAIDLAGESLARLPFGFVDGGGNTCGCGGADVACQVLSPGLDAPAANGM